MTTPRADALKNIDAIELLKSPVAKLLYNLWSKRVLDYRKIDRYMAGNQDLQFATQKFSNAFGMLFREQAENNFPRVVSAHSDYLQYKDVACDDEPSADMLTTWLEAQVFPVLLGQVNSDAVQYGNGYVATGIDDEDNLRIYRQDSRQCSVLYDPEKPDKLMAAFKIWQDPITNFYLLNIATRWAVYHYYADKTRTTPKLDVFKPFFDDSDPTNVIPEIVEHKVKGICPVWHFANDPDASGQGFSTLRDIFPLQDTLNKTKCDRLVAQEFQAFRQRWATGIEENVDPLTGAVIPPFVPAIDRMLISPSEGAKFGDFEPIDINQFLAAAKSDREAIASIAGIPAWHLVSMTGNFPSGESLKTAEMPLLLRTRDKQLAFSARWEDLFRYYFLSIGGEVPKNIKMNWVDMTPRDRLNEGQGDMAEANAAVTYHGLGVPKRQLLIEKGYTPEQIDTFETELQAEQERDNENAANALHATLNAAPVRSRLNMKNVANPNKNDQSGASS